MRLFNNPQKAFFISRPNRFTTICDLDGKKVKAYLPNPGRLWELLLPGAPLYLEKKRPGKQKLPYTVVAADKHDRHVVLHTHKANDTVQFLIEKNLVPGLEGAEVIRREIKKGNSRFDFLLRKGTHEIFLEVKSCTLFAGKIAMFPDSPTSRGKRHIEELDQLTDKNTKGAVLFLVNSINTEVFLPDFHTDLEFTHSLYSSRKKIMVIPLAIGWNENFSLKPLVKFLTIPWEIVEREAKDSGNYLVILRLPEKKSVEVGRLGTVNFKKGYYIYVGSAKKNLSKRIERHKRLRKKLFWHIDYLRAKAEYCAIIPIRTKDDLECTLAEALKPISDREIQGFGSSDCTCSSHLFAMDKNPISSSKFQDFLLYYRMERLLLKAENP